VLRSLLSTIASVPFLSKLSKADIQSNDINALKPEEVGKRILRAVNTVQHWHKGKGYRFVQRTQLFETAAWRDLQYDRGAEERGFGASLLSKLNTEKKEIYRNWRLSIATNEDETGYVALLTDSHNPNLSFATDEYGVIYQGKEIALLAEPQQLPRRL
jgi:hypothetical protein